MTGIDIEIFRKKDLLACTFSVERAMTTTFIFFNYFNLKRGGRNEYALYFLTLNQTMVWGYPHTIARGMSMVATPLSAITPTTQGVSQL